MGCEMNVWAYLCAAAMCAALSMTSNAAPHLEPCSAPVLDGYHDRVDALLDSSVEGQILVRFSAYPSFLPEHGIRIVKDENSYRVYHVVLLQQVWANSVPPATLKGTVRYELSEADLPRDTASIVLSDEIADALVELIGSEIDGAVVSNALGLDGVHYRFRFGPEACGTIWSPQDGTRTRKLVDLMGILGSIVRSKNPTALNRLQEAVETTVRELSVH